MLGIEIKRGVEATLERVFHATGNHFDKLTVVWNGKTAGVSAKKIGKGVDANVRTFTTVIAFCFVLRQLIVDELRRLNLTPLAVGTLLTFLAVISRVISRLVTLTTGITITRIAGIASGLRWIVWLILWLVLWFLCLLLQTIVQLNCNLNNLCSTTCFVCRLECPRQMLCVW